jgi:hypothetical protein
MARSREPALSEVAAAAESNGDLHFELLHPPGAPFQP